MSIQISYEGYCFLGGAANPKLYSKAIYNARGEYLQTRYYFIRES